VLFLQFLSVVCCGFRGLIVRRFFGKVELFAVLNVGIIPGIWLENIFLQRDVGRRWKRFWKRLPGHFDRGFLNIFALNIIVSEEMDEGKLIEELDFKLFN
jgi:hypothetical protein